MPLERSQPILQSSKPTFFQRLDDRLHQIPSLAHRLLLTILRYARLEHNNLFELGDLQIFLLQDALQQADPLLAAAQGLFQGVLLGGLLEGLLGVAFEGGLEGLLELAAFVFLAEELLVEGD
jgi:hypothetical protein